MPRGKPLSNKEKSRIEKFYLLGNSYRRIDEISGFSIAAVSKVVNEMLTRDPSLAELREFRRIEQPL